MSKWMYFSNALVIAMDIVMMVTNYQRGSYVWACIFAGLASALAVTTLIRAIEDWRDHK